MLSSRYIFNVRSTTVKSENNIRIRYTEILISMANVYSCFVIRIQKGIQLFLEENKDVFFSM